MASNFKISTASRNAACDAIVDLIDAGSGAGTLTVRTGAPPTNVSDSDSGTLLGTLTMSATAFGASSGGTATADTITSDPSADATGTAGHFRIYDSDSNCICQGTAGVSGDSPDLVLDSASIVAGGTIAVTSLTITVPVQ